MKKKTIRFLPILIVAIFLATCGCTYLAPMEQEETPTGPSTGSLTVSSTPWGARVFVDGNYEGKAPTTITNLPVGEHEVILTMNDYEDATNTVTIIGGETASLKVSMPKAQPKITLTITSVNSGVKTPRCYWEIKGTVTNEGSAVATGMSLEGTVDPRDSEYSTVKKTISMGALNPGETRDYFIYIDNAPCVDSTGSVKCTYLDADDKEKSASKSI
jgi:hypothetical protein